MAIASSEIPKRVFIRHGEGFLRLLWWTDSYASYGSTQASAVEVLLREIFPLGLRYATKKIPVIELAIVPPIRRFHMCLQRTVDIELGGDSAGVFAAERRIGGRGLERDLIRHDDQRWLPAKISHQVTHRRHFWCRIHPRERTPLRHSADDMVKLCGHRHVGIDRHPATDQGWISADSNCAQQGREESVLVFTIAILVRENFRRRVR